MSITTRRKDITTRRKSRRFCAGLRDSGFRLRENRNNRYRCRKLSKIYICVQINIARNQGKDDRVWQLSKKRKVQSAKCKVGGTNDFALWTLNFELPNSPTKYWGSVAKSMGKTVRIRQSRMRFFWGMDCWKWYFLPWKWSILGKYHRMMPFWCPQSNLNLTFAA